MSTLNVANGNEPIFFIDLNCDVGESVGANIVGNDDALIPLVSSANIACGGHGGDSRHTTNAVRVAMENGVVIGAHPSYPDRANFGRKRMVMSSEELRDALNSQLIYLNDIVTGLSGTVAYVKPHGALYHACAEESETAEVFLQTVLEFDRGLSVMGQSGTEIEKVCAESNVKFIREAFADRGYLSSGRLKPRIEPGAVFECDSEIAAQALSIATGGGVTTDSNHRINIHADSICIHGDSVRALTGLKQIRSVFFNNRVAVKAV